MTLKVVRGIQFESSFVAGVGTSCWLKSTLHLQAMVIALPELGVQWELFLNVK
jgi:hypothetical protein